MTFGKTIPAENCLEGHDSTDWDINAAGDPSIQGFAMPFSLTPSAAVEFRVKTDSTDYRVDIYRIGYYGGKGKHVHPDLLCSPPQITLPLE